MAVFALFQLLLLAGALPQLDQHIIPKSFVYHCEQLLLASLPIFWAEIALRQLWIEKGVTWRTRRVYSIVICMVPPLRLGLTPITAPDCVWAPGLGWLRVGRKSARRMAKAMSVPMIVIALMILPALMLEFVFRNYVKDHPGAAVVLDLTLRLIWLAFAVELVAMVAVSRRKVEYCTRHWVDVLIVLFPFVAFLRVFRIGAVVRTSKLAALARTYRLRAVSFRLLRAILLLRLLDRVSLGFAEKRVASLRRRIDKHERHIDELREEIGELEQVIAACKHQRREKRRAKALAKAAASTASDE